MKSWYTARKQYQFKNWWKRKRMRNAKVSKNASVGKTIEILKQLRRKMQRNNYDTDNLTITVLNRIFFNIDWLLCLF